MSHTDYWVEYSKSGRASCKVCKGNIEKGALRIATATDGPGDYPIVGYRHLQCQKVPKAWCDLSALGGLSNLEPADRTSVETWFATSKNAPAATKSVGNKRKADDVGDTSGGAVAAGGTPPATAKPDLTTVNVKKMKAAERKAALAAYGLPTGGKKGEQDNLLEELAQRQKAVAKFSALSVAALKDALRLNNQIVGGTKDELIDRCVDGLVYGTLPKCPQCGAGRLKVAYGAAYGHGGNGRFFCPGYHDGDCFVRCGFSSTDVERPEWIGDLPASAKSSPTGAATGAAAASSSAAVVDDAPKSKKAKGKAPMKAPAQVRVMMPGDDD